MPCSPALARQSRHEHLDELFRLRAIVCRKLEGDGARAERMAEDFACTRVEDGAGVHADGVDEELRLAAAVGDERRDVGVSTRERRS